MEDERESTFTICKTERKKAQNEFLYTHMTKMYAKKQVFPPKKILLGMESIVSLHW